MVYEYIIETKVAVLFLSVILCAYIRIVYSGASSNEKRYIALSYALTLANLVTVICAIFDPESGKHSLAVRLASGIAWQLAINVGCFAYMRYLGDFGPDTPLKQKMRYAQNIVMGSFFYFQLVSLFIGLGGNYVVLPEGAGLTHGSLYFLLMHGYSLMWIAWALVMQCINRNAFTKGQWWGLLASNLVSLVFLSAHALYFPDVHIRFVVLTFNLYVFFFLLETPAYGEVEKTLTKLKKAKAMAEEAKVAAVKANEAKGEFLANMSHEIRTPLTTILGMDEVIIKKYEEGPIYEYARDIHSAGNTLLHIINDILDFSKIESGQLELTSKNYKLGRVLRDVDNMIRMRAQQKGLEYITQIDQTLPNDLFGDHTRVHQIMVNILNNAVKYTKRGSVKFSLTGERGTDPSFITLHIIVTDTGIGIHSEDLPKLFQSFNRLDMKENHGVEGTGLGLAITGRLIDMMGGNVEVESTYGVGTTFHVVLPQRITGTMTLKEFEEQDAHASKKVRKTAVIAPDARVLVVDDNEMNRVVLRALMKDTKVQVDTVEGGEECLEKVKDTAYDVILMDYMMPHMDGKETLENIRKMENCASAGAKVVVCTANAIVGVQAELLAAGFDDFLSKPVNGKALEEVLARYIPKEKQQEAAS
ncbi:MAG: response regulator [Fretibacterium sp.]|nr:response regulator [Fretibacterium sp.]